jgi:hypothetical protein
MNKRSSVAASTVAPKINIARRYLQLQRLRLLVQRAESSHVRHVVDINAVPELTRSVDGRSIHRAKITIRDGKLARNP